MLTNEAKNEVLELLDRLDANFNRSWSANEYESGVERGHDRLLGDVKDGLCLNKCFDCGKYLDKDQSTFCTEHRELFEQAKKLSRY
jgi:hypothetical protein